MDKRSMFYGATQGIFEKASMLRRNETIAEKTLWERLRNNQLNGLRFKRQHPISNFVADFYCHKLRLVIEVDEQYHDQPAQTLDDLNRNRIMADLGLHVLRFSEHDILNDMDETLNKITRQMEGMERI